MKKCDCNPPKALEIKCPGEVILFRKVEIPAEMGDDVTYPPRPGMYRNVLLVYKANQHVYMYSSDGMPTMISDGGKGVTDYEELENKPSIDGYELIGDVTLEDIGVVDAIDDALEDYTPTDGLADVALSGDYDDLINKPTIPVVNDATLTVKRNNESVGTFTANSATDTDINITVPVTAADVHALPDSTKYGASIVMSINTTDYKVTTTLKDQDGNTLGTAQVIDLPLESVVVNGSYDSVNKKIILTLQNGNTIDIPVGDLISGLQTEITPTNMLSADLVDDTSTTHKFTTAADISKLAGIETGAEVNVQSNWNETDSSSDAYIQNKPSIPTQTSALTNNGSDGTSVYVEADELATVATTGSYNDLTDKPADFELVEMSYGESNAWAKFIAAYQAKKIVYCRASSNSNPATGTQGRKAFMAYVNNADNPTEVEFQYVRSVSTKTESQPVDQVFVYKLTNASGGTWTVQTRDMGPKLVQGTNTTVSYSNGTYTISATQPTVPTKTSDLTNDGSDGTSTYVEADDLATVATSGSYNDLSNKPTIPAAQVNSDWNASSGVAQILNKPTLATVATSGSYNDLSNKPTIPTVNNASLYIQKNGTTVNTFTANQSVDAVANITVPTATSDLTNDSGYITNADLPTKTSDLQNDGSDGTAAYLETDETAYKTASIPYGVCDGTSTSTVFTATVPGVTELRDGVCMWLKNGVVTSASGFTININGLGAKPVYNNMAAATRDTTIWNVNYTMFFVYDSTRVEGGCWILYRGYNSDNNTIGYQLRTNSTSLTTTDRTRYYRLLFTSADNTHWVPANTQYDNSATSNKTVNQRKINPFGRIVYLGNSTSYLADAAVTATAVWDQYAFNLGYSFSKGSALTMTYPKPVYVKCAPQSDGSAIIDSTTPYVQDLPSTEDGKIYIYLGIAYSATNVEMVINHPIYYYKDGAIREWTNATAGIASVAWGDITGTLSDQTDLNTALGAKANSADLATVATSGSYNDLTNKPTIPTVNNATLTIQKNSTNVATFTANASSNVTANISVPTATSDLTNDSGFITSITKITNAEIDAIMGVA